MHSDTAPSPKTHTPKLTTTAPQTPVRLPMEPQIDHPPIGSHVPPSVMCMPEARIGIAVDGEAESGKAAPPPRRHTRTSLQPRSVSKKSTPHRRVDVPRPPRCMCALSIHTKRALNLTAPAPEASAVASKEASTPRQRASALSLAESPHVSSRSPPRCAKACRPPASRTYDLASPTRPGIGSTETFPSGATAHKYRQAYAGAHTPPRTRNAGGEKRKTGVGGATLRIYKPTPRHVSPYPHPLSRREQGKDARWVTAHLQAHEDARIIKPARAIPGSSKRKPRTGRDAGEQKTKTRAGQEDTARTLGKKVCALLSSARAARSEQSVLVGEGVSPYDEDAAVSRPSVSARSGVGEVATRTRTRTRTLVCGRRCETASPSRGWVCDAATAMPQRPQTKGARRVGEGSDEIPAPLRAFALDL
ncbi:hypothetical protein C8J57DRAFT_1503273 [Mycena rebaudengoi]|nr:hypothetical protein C8J57DRAFT_1503273 [Mycena rebaudengoi]